MGDTNSNMADSVTESTSAAVLEALDATLRQRLGASPESSYVAALYSAGEDAILKKVGEEATEFILAAKETIEGVEPDHLIKETADLWFHTMVLLAHKGLGPAQVLSELESRFGQSGLAEKAARNTQEG